MSDIAATADGTDIDFSREPIAGVEEYRQAALSRVSNEVSFEDPAYGIDLALELGKPGSADTIGIRASAAIMNDDRFTSAKLASSREVRTDGLLEIFLSFDVVADETVAFSLDVLVANGEVVLAI